MTCALCDIEITTANDSKEHLIPNAIGGRKKVRGILCRTCNSTAGDKWDSELAEQLNFLTLNFSIRRQRGGEAPSQEVKTIKGEAWQVHPGGKLGLADPSCVATPTGAGGFDVQIKARTMAEARKMVEGLARKNPSIDVDAAMQGAQKHSVYLDDVLQIPFSFGGGNAGRSVVKSTLCLAVDAGVDAGDCPDGRNYLRNAGAQACFDYFYGRDLVIARPARTPMHCVAVSNKGTEGQLLGYVELYGAYRMVVRLAENYSGPDVSCSYAIDPVTTQELNVAIDLQLTRRDVADTMRHERAPLDAFRAAMESTISIFMDAQREQEWERVRDEAIDYAFKNCGATEEAGVTADHVPELTRLFLEKIAPYLWRR